MCGIYGTTIPYNNDQLREKLDRTRFRGPDQSHILKLKDSNVYLGHNRLSVVDLDRRSDQPLRYHYLTIVYNGEIYNFKHLKKELEKEDYKFRTKSDTEVICAAYLKYGTECTKHFNGMFAFVIHDAKKNVFFGARDRLGQKPFYYYHDGLKFEFASQISTIKLHHQNVSISKKSIAEYLRWGAIPEPCSIFNEIKKLKPGHSFTYSLDSGNLNKWSYWDLSRETNTYAKSYEQAKEDLNTLLKNAVDIRMYADVPVGIFLSGGVDSSLIAAIAAKTVDQQINTFSVKFNEKGFDESSYAQKVAQHIGSKHHSIECNFKEGLALIENFHQYYDEPFADASAIPSMLLAKHTKNYVTVALSGDGGDESFLGYQRYKWMKQVEPLFKMPGIIRKTLSKACVLAPYYRIKTVGKGLEFNALEELYTTTISSMDLDWIDHRWQPKEFAESQFLYSDKPFLERVSDFDLKAYINWHINTKVDRASMAFSLESRSPLMDYRIVEFAKDLPISYKFHGNEQKRILKDILYQYVPKPLFNRSKAGFTMPFENWFRNELRELVLSELNALELKELPCVHANTVDLMIKQHMDGSWNRYPIIWKLLVLKQWLNENSVGISTH